MHDVHCTVDKSACLAFFLSFHVRLFVARDLRILYGAQKRRVPFFSVFVAPVHDFSRSNPPDVKVCPVLVLSTKCTVHTPAKHAPFSLSSHTQLSTCVYAPEYPPHHTKNKTHVKQSWQPFRNTSSRTSQRSFQYTSSTHRDIGRYFEGIICN